VAHSALSDLLAGFREKRRKRRKRVKGRGRAMGR